MQQRPIYSARARALFAANVTRVSPSELGVGFAAVAAAYVNGRPNKGGCYRSIEPPSRARSRDVNGSGIAQNVIIIIII